MVEAKELRIGSMIAYGAHGLVIVNEIKASGKIRVTYAEQSSIDHGYINSLLWGDYLDPIPLTEEWLAKLGFALSENQCASRRGFDHGRGAVFVIQRIRPDSGWFFHWGNVVDTPVEYVHHLQNLFHSLTGNELTLKEIA